MDVKAEHFERQVARIEAERDTWEKKAEEAQEKYAASKRELDEVCHGAVSVHRSVGLTSCMFEGRAPDGVDLKAQPRCRSNIIVVLFCRSREMRMKGKRLCSEPL